MRQQSHTEVSSGLAKPDVNCVPRFQMLCSKKIMVRSGVSQYAMTFKTFSITEERWFPPATAAARKITLLVATTIVEEAL